MKSKIPTAQEKREIAARAFALVETVYKAYRTPEKCRATTIERITKAAAEIGAPLPPVKP
jgi:hypothetical protein